MVYHTYDIYYIYIYVCVISRVSLSYIPVLLYFLVTVGGSIIADFFSSIRWGRHDSCATVCYHAASYVQTSYIHMYQHYCTVLYFFPSHCSIIAEFFFFSRFSLTATPVAAFEHRPHPVGGAMRKEPPRWPMALKLLADMER